MYTHRYMYIHRNTHAQTHVHTYTDTHTQTHVHTHRHMYTHAYMYTDADTCTDTHMYIHTDTCTCIHRQTHTPPPIKSCSTSLFTHRAGYCTLGGGREHTTHSFLCFHCAQLLSSLKAPSANDRSSLSSKPAQQDGLGGHTRPDHNFHSP
ncbi:unnamed protein product [Staurois parvus]|uniref:Uncharacterized protein n=1 Tax=Staurois parvus TaxID=386267 RepID=A0ABN9DGS9_9NEOB|nr:unnamed protein product [Staurois parvus]